MTISVWVKLASTSGPQDFVAFNDGAGNGIKLGLNGGTLSAWTWAGTSLVTGTTPVDGGWHNIVYSYDQTNNTLYVDGVAATSTTTAHQTGTITQAVLGSADGTQEFLNGSLDEVRVYKAALTAAQVAQLGAGRYPGTGGYQTVTLGGATTVSGALTLDAGNLNANGNTVSCGRGELRQRGRVHGGQRGADVLRWARGATGRHDDDGVRNRERGPGERDRPHARRDAFNASAARATITSVAGRYTFQIGSIATATPTLNISGLTVKNVDSNGMWINSNASATDQHHRVRQHRVQQRHWQSTLADYGGSALPTVERVHVRRQHYLRGQDGR